MGNSVSEWQELGGLEYRPGASDTANASQAEGRAAIANTLSMSFLDVPTVHAVTDPRILRDPEFKFKAASVFRALGAAGAVHLRGLGMPVIAVYRLAEFLSPLQTVTGCLLVINDRVDVAIAVGARGVQLRRTSLSLADARRAAGQSASRVRFGVSIHEPSEASAAVADGAAWVMAGNIHESASHRGRPARGTEFVRAVAATGAIVIAIGGIRAEQAKALRLHGAHGIAAIRGIWDANDPAAAARAYL
jgi:thiamine-phosphate diphosphorylase